MSGLFNRLKSRKTGSPAPVNNSNNNTHESEPTTPACAFDEEGFLCPICHQKFTDHTELAQHYTDTHAQESVTEKETFNDFKPAPKQEEKQENIDPDVALWKQQFIASEESRMLISNELIQQKQRSDDLEEELQLLQKHLKSTQNTVVEQSQEIASLKATKDVYDAQLAIFTDELLNTKDELKAKQHQVATLCNDLIPRSTTDDVNVLKRELITVQQCMNEMALEKEQQIGELRAILIENDQSVQRLNQVENRLSQNLSLCDELFKENTSLVENGIIQMKQSIRIARERKNKLQNNLLENQTIVKQLQQTNIQLQSDLGQQKQMNTKLTNDLQTEQRQTNSYRNQIEILNNEIQTLEKNLHELREEKNHFIQTKMSGDEDHERQNLLRQITQEKEQYEQQTKDLRIQIKQINNQRQQIQDELDQISQQLLQITNEKNQLENEQNHDKKELDLLRKQLDDNNKDKERRINEFKHEIFTLREQSTFVGNDLQKANESNKNQKREIERLKREVTDQMTRFEQEKNDWKQTFHQQKQSENELKTRLDSMQKQKLDIEQQLQDLLNQKDIRIKRLSSGIHRSLDLVHKTQEYFQTKISTNQNNLLSIIEQAEQESRSIRIQTLEQIREEFTHYLTVYHTLFIESKTQFEKQIEKENLKLIEQQQQSEKQLNKLKHEHEKLIGIHHDKKQKLEIQLGELNHQVLQVSESLSEATQAIDTQREKYDKQIKSLERELESRTKRHEMQLSALTENLSTVRTELRATNEKVVILEQIKAEKADTDARLAVSQEERRVLLERSLASESKYEKLLFENGQLTKKNTDLDAALQEIAREFQVLQIQANKFNQRRWLDDDDVHGCMKCNQTFSVTQRKHHCRSCGNIFCDSCSAKTAIVAATSKKPQRVCDQCYKDLTS
ncbi:hypothetical protein I4U23_024682 [Adineta vaga]|nr:hypothetical protein I4U23_024682 [Adineta vaga]